MATRPRKGLPEFWISSLAKFLAGENQCEWAIWFRARFRYDKLEDPDFDSAAYTHEHNALLATKKSGLLASGYRVDAEKYVRATGTFSVLVGKIDLLAQKDGTTLVIDGKTGQKRHSDWWQVLTYMLALPIAWERPTLRVVGEVVYKDGTKRSIEPEELTAEHRSHITGTAKRIALMTDPPPWTPSEQECRYCNIGPNDCPKRIGPQAAVVVPQTELF